MHRGQCLPSAAGPSMRVDFYILEAAAENERLRTACRLTEKAWQMGHRVFIHTDSNETARHVDDMLWTYRQDSFVPHALLRDRLNVRADDVEPVLIGDGASEPADVDVLINLTETVPAFASRCERVAEIVDGSTASKQSGRDRYKKYRAMGIEPVTHNID